MKETAIAHIAHVVKIERSCQWNYHALLQVIPLAFFIDINAGGIRECNGKAASYPQRPIQLLSQPPFFCFIQTLF